MDSPERAQNLDLVVEQLMALKDSIRMEIRILEADEHPHYELKISDEHIHKTFVRDASPVFHRTKYLNRLMQEAEGRLSVYGIPMCCFRKSKYWKLLMP